MEREYQTVEQKIWNSVGKSLLDCHENMGGHVADCWDNVGEPLTEYFSGLSKGFYGALITPFRLPTFVRKLDNYQLFTFRVSPREKFTGIIGSLLGLFSIPYSIMSASPTGNWLQHKISEGDYTVPLIAGAVLTATNLASFGFELGRVNGLRQRQENEGEEE